MIDLDLPSLQSIKLGQYALCGNNVSECSLIMRSNNELNQNDRM